MIDDIKISEPVFLRNLVLLPLRKETSDGLSLSSIDEVLGSGKDVFGELDTPDVNTIVFRNDSDNPLLIIDGEEITGSLQNRIIARSDIVEKMESKEVPVICVEEGRWEDIGGFQTGSCSYPRLRSILSRRLEKTGTSLQRTQNLIWHEITRKLTATRTKSTTSSMHDIYENLNEELSRYTEGFSRLNTNTVGFIGVAGNTILGCDLFGSHNLYKKFEEKLIKSYALDAIEYQSMRTSIPEANRFLQGVLGSVKITKKRNSISFRKKEFSGQALIYKNKLAHLSAFPRP